MCVLCVLFKCVTGEERDGNALARGTQKRLSFLSAQSVVSLSIITSFASAMKRSSTPAPNKHASTATSRLQVRELAKKEEEKREK